LDDEATLQEKCGKLTFIQVLPTKAYQFTATMAENLNGAAIDTADTCPSTVDDSSYSYHPLGHKAVG
jgi:hypothetical protein